MMAHLGSFALTGVWLGQADTETQWHMLRGGDVWSQVNQLQCQTCPGKLGQCPAPSCWGSGPAGLLMRGVGPGHSAGSLAVPGPDLTGRLWALSTWPVSRLLAPS